MNPSCLKFPPSGLVQTTSALPPNPAGITAGGNLTGVFAWMALLAGLLFHLACPPSVRAHASPVGCTGSGLGIFLFTDSPDVHIGDTLTYSITVYNGANFGPVVCDATAIMAYVITPDGISHPISLVRTNLSNGQADFYPNVVSYVVRAQDVQPDGTVRSRATDTGVIHQNDTDSQGGGNQGVNTQVSLPCIGITAQCTGSVGENGAITFSGMVTNCGNNTLVNVTITNFVNGGQFPVMFITNLLQGQSAAFSGSWVPLNPCGPSTATFVAMGVDQFTTHPRTMTSMATNTCGVVLTAGIQINKTCPLVAPAPGQLLTFSGSITNTGNVTLTGIVVVNNQPVPNTTVFTAAALAPGAVTNFTGSYLAPASCSVSDTLSVTATSRCGVPVTNSASANCPVKTTPVITVTQNCPLNPPLPGGLLIYSGTVSNSGVTTLTNIIVVSDRPASNTLVFTTATLAPGASTNFSGSFVTPLNCCVVWSTLQASGQDCSGATALDTETRACPVLTLPALVVSKTCTSGILRPGDLLTYSGSVSNSGTITLINVSVANNQSPGVPLLPNPVDLAPGETINFNGSYIVQPDFCGNDTVTATALDICTYLPVTNSISTTCPITTAPRITVTKNCPTLPTLRGGLYTYTGSVSNAGNVTLVNVYVTDNAPSNNTPVIGPITLIPGMGVNFTNSYVAPVCCCLIFDTLTARGQDHCSGGIVFASATAVCPLLTTPRIGLVQFCPADPIPMGSLYQYSGYVTNTGDVVLTNVFVYGPQGISAPLVGPLELAPKESKIYSGAYTVPFNTCSVTVTAVGQETCGGTFATNSASCPVATTPLLLVTQNCPLVPAVSGGLLTFSGSVSNAGNITLTGVRVLNNLSGATPVYTNAFLAPGMAANFTGSYLAPASCFSTSLSTATAVSICGAGVTNQAGSTCPIITTPGLAVTQSCPLTPVVPGGLFTYSGSVSNAGNILLTNVTVLNNLSGLTPLIAAATLAPGAVTNFSGSYLAPTNCFTTSTSTATGQSLCGISVTNTVISTCPISTQPLIVIVQNCPLIPAVPGGLFTYSGSVSNAGNILLTNVTVLNNLSGLTPVLAAATLAPGAVTNFSGSYIAPTNCFTTSTSTATGQSLCGINITNTVISTCPIVTTPQIVVVQNCPLIPAVPGGLFTYSGSVSNAGNILLTNVTVLNNLSGLTPVLAAATLAPGAVTNFSGSYLAPTNCFTTSTSTATGRSLCGIAVTNTTSSTCPISTTPQIAITQNCPLLTVVPGGLLTYSGSVSNAGNTTLTNVMVLNNLSGITPILTMASLAPGAVTNFTGSYIAPTNCFSTSLSTAIGQSTCGLAVTNTTSSTCPIATTPQIAITQNCPLITVVPGGLLTYSGSVSNAGNTTLTNVMVLNNLSGLTPILTMASLAPGAVTNFTGSYIAPTNCFSTSLSTAIGQSTCGLAVTNTTSTTCPIGTTPLISITQNCPLITVVPGGLLTYSGSVSNAGNTMLTNVMVLNNLSGLTPILTMASLAPGAVTNFTGSYIAPTNCFSTSLSTAIGQSTCGLAVTNATSTTCPIGTTPLISITQNCPLITVVPGGLLTYSGSVSNAGNTTLTNVMVLNNLSGITPILAVASLAPGAVTNFTGSYIAPTNCFSTSLSTAIGQSTCGLAVTNTTSSTCPIGTTPLISITQNCPLITVVPGGLLTYSGSVSNAGNTTLTNVMVLNNLSGITPILTVASLAPGAVTNFTGSYIAPTNCFSTSLSTAIGQSTCGLAVTNTTSSTCPIGTTPLISITQNCPLITVVPGGLLTYSGSVSNAGNTTLTNVMVLNNLSGLMPILTVASLAPGAVTNFTGSYIAPTNCFSTSTSIATGQSICGLAVTNTAISICPIGSMPQIVVAAACPLIPVVPGGLLTYSGSVSNAGTMALTNVVVVSDRPLANTTVFTVALLAPGVVTNFTSSYVVLTNTCSVMTTFTGTGRDICSLLSVTNTVSTTCQVTSTPAIFITETCPPGPVSAGTLVAYSGLVSNPGNITLMNVLVYSSQPSNGTPVLGPITLIPGASVPYAGTYIATGGANPMTNSTIITNSTSLIITNSNSIIITNTITTFSTNVVTPKFGTIDPVSGAMVDRFAVPTGLKGLMFADQDENWGPTLFYVTQHPTNGPDTFDSISTIAPNAGTVSNLFTLTATNYDALSLSAPNVGYGVNNFYYVRHDSSNSPFFGVIKAAGASSSSDLWSLINSGYTGLAFAAANVGAYGANLFYYVRNDGTGLTSFGTINPTPGGIETDRYLVGTNFDSLVFVPGTVSTWGTAIFAYLRHTAVGSVIGTIDPVTHVVTDRISLGTNQLNDLTFTATDAGYGANLFYYISPQITILTTNILITFNTNIVVTFTTNTVSTFVTNNLVTFTPTNTVTAMGMDICQNRTVMAAANCSGPVGLALVTPLAPFITAPVMTSGSFNLSIASQTGKSYTVQAKGKLTDLTWTNLQTVPGTGGLLILTNPTSPLQPTRFYRIMITP